MSDFKPGDKVLVEGEFQEMRDLGCCVVEVPSMELARSVRSLTFENTVHAHPGVPVAALEKEADVAAKLIDSVMKCGYVESSQWWREYADTRNAREAAQSPVYREGDEVWVRGVVERGAKGAVYVGHPSLGSTSAGGYFCPDDIRKEEE